MTRNQLTYHANKEIERHNSQVEQLDQAKLDETERSNRANEQLSHEKNLMSKYAADKKLQGDQTKAHASLLGNLGGIASKLISNFK